MWAWVSLLPWPEVLWQGAISAWGGAGLCCPFSARGPSGPCLGTESCRVPSYCEHWPLQEGPVTDPGLHGCQNGGFCAVRLYLEILSEPMCGAGLAETVPAVE